MIGAARHSGPTLLLAAALVLSGCWAGADDQAGSEASSHPSGPAASPAPSRETSPSTSPEPSASPEAPTTPVPTRSADPAIEPVTPAQWKRIVATGAWHPGCPVRRRDLRRVEVNHHTFSGEVRRGVLVVNRDVAASVARIFTRLFEAGFPIRKMVPVTAYGGDANASLRDDNTSAYNCRRPSQINAPAMESPHANGRAVDINPRENPWTDLRCDCWFPSSRHRARTPGPGKILKGGVVWRAFRQEGWIWQDIDVPDYMHFDTGYPSGPFRELTR